IPLLARTWLRIRSRFFRQLRSSLATLMVTAIGCLSLSAWQTCSPQKKERNGLKNRFKNSSAVLTHRERERPKARDVNKGRHNQLYATMILIEWVLASTHTKIASTA